MSEKKHMDEFARNEQENMAAARSHWDDALAAELGIPTVRTTWKKQERVVVRNPSTHTSYKAIMERLAQQTIENTLKGRSR